jgi:hypothetical protein
VTPHLEHKQNVFHRRLQRADLRAAIFSIWDQRNMEQRTAFFSVLGWNQSTLNFDRWLGNATMETIVKLGSGVRAGELVGYEVASVHPSGWAFRAPENAL